MTSSMLRDIAPFEFELEAEAEVESPPDTDPVDFEGCEVFVFVADAN
jgi:hypothetical protein